MYLKYRYERLTAGKVVCRAIALFSFTSSVLFVISDARATDGIPQESPWVEHAGQRHTMTQLTGVPFDQVKQCLAEALNDEPPTRLSLSPETAPPPWKSDARINGVQFYYHQADGVITYFLARQVMEGFEAQFNVKRADFVISREVTHGSRAICPDPDTPRSQL